MVFMDTTNFISSSDRLAECVLKWKKYRAVFYAKGSHLSLSRKPNCSQCHLSLSLKPNCSQCHLSLSRKPNCSQCHLSLSRKPNCSQCHLSLSRKPNCSQCHLSLSQKPIIALNFLIQLLSLSFNCAHISH